MSAIWASVALILGAFGAAMALTWRKWARQPVAVEREVEGPTCYPQVKR